MFPVTIKLWYTDVLNLPIKKYRYLYKISAEMMRCYHAVSFPLQYRGGGEFFLII